MSLVVLWSQIFIDLLLFQLKWMETGKTFDRQHGHSVKCLVRSRNSVYSLAKLFVVCWEVLCQTHLIDNLFLPTHPGMPTCRCPNGFTGSQCNKPVCMDYCLNNGSCTVNQGNQPNCRCPDSYVGDKCQFRKYSQASLKRCPVGLEGQSLPTSRCQEYPKF